MIDVGSTVPYSVLLDAIVTVYLLTVFVKVAVIVMSCSTVPEADDQESNAYVYWAVAGEGVAVTV